MARDSRSPDLFGRIGLGLLLAALLIVGFRAQRTSQMTLARDWNTGPHLSREAQIPISHTSLNENGSTIPPRDPFRYLDSTKPRNERPKAVEDKNTLVPVLGALLYDTVNPQVQLRVAGEASGWMGTGAVFEGWVVVAIQPDAVTVQKQGERLVLR